MGDFFGFVNKLVDNIISPPVYNGFDEDPFKEERMMANTNMASALALGSEKKQLNDEIRKRNPKYSPEEMLAYAKKVFELLLGTRNTQNLDSIQHFLHEDLYKNICSEYSQLIAQNVINYVKNVSVVKKQIKSYSIEYNREVISIELKVRYMSYDITADTRQYITGNRYDAKPYQIDMQFVKNVNYDEEAEKNPTNCPNCGAPLDEVYINVCSYCGTVVPLPKKEWLLLEYSQKPTVIGNT